MFDEEVLGL